MFHTLVCALTMAILPNTLLAEFRAGFPQLASVIGVAADDALNVRAEPRGSSEDIGDLAPNSIVEVLELDKSRKWARILHQEGNGWVAARFLQERSYLTTNAGVPLGLMCIGNEPFWSLALNTDQSLTFEQANLGRRTFQSTWNTRSANMGGAVYGIATQDVQAILRRAACSDGMSDRTYGWSVDVLTAGKEQPTLLSGCCFADLE